MVKTLTHARPPSYLSCSSLARELDMSESAVRDLVKRGTLPPPVRISNGSVRWRWCDVQERLGGQSRNGPALKADPYMVGALNAAKA